MSVGLRVSGIPAAGTRNMAPVGVLRRGVRTSGEKKEFEIPKGNCNCDRPSIGVDAKQAK